MFANTLTITIDGTANVLTRVNQDNYGSEYKLASATALMILKFRNSTEKQNGQEEVYRHNMFFEHTVFATPTASEKYYTMTATMRSRKTSDPAWLDKIAAGFVTLLSAQKTGLIGGES